MVLRPSTKSLQQACQLGIQMAKRERRIMPILSGASHHATFVQFMTAHRHRLEILPAFEQWDRALHKIADQEGKRLGLKPHDHTQWDDFLHQVFNPVRCSFWFGWEGVYNLRKLYDQEMELARRQAEAPSVLRVFNPPISPLIPQSPLPDRFYDMKEWDQMASDMASLELSPEDVPEEPRSAES